MRSVLIIDDSSEFRAVFKEVLQKSGYNVIEASNGQEGIELYRRTPTDIVITDLIMPGKEGLQTIMDLNREFPGVKIIAMSGGGFESPCTYLEGAKFIGGVKYTFSKPFAMGAMIDAINELLEK